MTIARILGDRSFRFEPMANQDPAIPATVCPVEVCDIDQGDRFPGLADQRRIQCLKPLQQ